MIRVGLVGCGFMGRMHSSVYQTLENAKLVAVADSKPENAKSIANQYGIPCEASLTELLKNHELDAIDICLPTHLHCQATVEAANAGKNILCEKPMALTVEECDEMIEACDRNGAKLMIGHCIRFWPEYAYVKDLMDSKTLGKLTSINMTRYGEFPTWSVDNWLADESLSGGGVLDMHIHDTDFALYLLGEPRQATSAGTFDSRGPSQVYTNFVYEDCIAHLQGGWNLPERTPFKMAFRAIFENGAAIFDGGPLTIYTNGSAPFTPEFPKMQAQGGGNISDMGGYYHEIKYFVDCLISGTPFETVTPQTSRLSVKATLEEIQNMRESGKQ